MLLDLLTSLTPAFAPGGAPASTPPGNVLVIVMDDVGCDLVGAYDTYFQSQGRAAGVPAETPAIDNLLAARGVMFTNCWTAPMCSPSRARMLTGRYGFRTGIGSVLKENDSTYVRNPGLGEGQVLLPQVLHQAPTPYMCVALGKWHLGDFDQVTLNPEHALGVPVGTWFDRYAGSLMNLWQPPNGGGQTVYSSWLKTYASFLDPNVNPCPSGFPPCDVGVIAPPVSAYATVDTTEDALLMMQTLPEPWFLYVSYNAVHLPAHDVPSGLPSAACGGYVPSISTCDPGTPPTVPGRVRCEMRELDTQIGRLLCAVDEGDTTVVLFGDNGTDGQATLPPHIPSHAKGSMYEDGCRVPMIVRSPLQTPATVGTVCTALVASTDLFASVAQIAGIAPSTLAAEDSVSFVPYLSGQTHPLRGTIYTEGFYPNFRPDPLTGWTPSNYIATRHNQALRLDRFKLIRRWERDHANPTLITLSEEFYDLLQGGPPDTSTTPPTPTPDWFEQNDLLASGLPLSARADRALSSLRRRLDLSYPTVVQ